MLKWKKERKKMKKTRNLNAVCCMSWPRLYIPEQRDLGSVSWRCERSGCLSFFFFLFTGYFLVVLIYSVLFSFLLISITIIILTVLLYFIFYLLSIFFSPLFTRIHCQVFLYFIFFIDSLFDLYLFVYLARDDEDYDEKRKVR